MWESSDCRRGGSCRPLETEPRRSKHELGQSEPQDNPFWASGSGCTPRTSQQQVGDEAVWRRVGAAGPHIRVEDEENTLFPRHSVLPSLPPSLLAELRLGK